MKEGTDIKTEKESVLWKGPPLLRYAAIPRPYRKGGKVPNVPVLLSSLLPLTIPNWKPEGKKGFDIVCIGQPLRASSKMEKSRV